MKFAWLIKLSETPDKFLASDLRVVDRAEAVIAKRDKQIQRAKKLFGETWEQHVELLEVDWEEWSAYIGRKGGNKRTPAKQRHIRELARWRKIKSGKKHRRHKRKTGPKIRRGVKPFRKIRWWMRGERAVCAKSIDLANRYIRRVDKSVPRGQIAKEWEQIKPEGIAQNRIGVYGFTEGKWKKIL